MEEILNHPSVSDAQIEYQSWEPKIREEQKTAESTITDEEISRIEKLVLDSFQEYFSLQQITEVQPEIQEKTVVKSFKSIAESQKTGGYTYFSLKNGESLCLLHFSNLFSVDMLEVLLGGNLDYKVSGSDRIELGEFDGSSLSLVSKCIIEKIAKKMRLDHFPNQPNNVDDDLICYCFRVNFKEKQDDYFVNFIVSESLIKANLKEKSKTNQNKNIRIGNTLFEMQSNIFKSDVDLSYVLNLSEGDLIPIESKDKVIVSINDTEFFRGTLGTLGHLRALKISKIAFLVSDIWKRLM